MNGTSPCSGRVEVLHNDAWGTICDASWELQDAQVVCSQLGCGKASKALGGAHYGQGLGPIWLENINCTGGEAFLKECQKGGWGEHSCNHSQDASVECSGTRLVNGTNRCSGRVEVFLDGEWGSVCDDRWDLSDAQVVCRELGCGGALSAPGNAHFGKGNGAIWIDEAQCLGTEVALQKCPFERKHYCSHKEDAGVVCSEDLRLVNGASRCSGRVEVLHNGAWGTICDASWDLQDAQVICRELGCGNASKALGRAHYGQGSGPIWLENINCTGEEASLKECQKGGWGEHSCRHSQDASVECSGTRLVNGTNHCSGRVEVFRYGEWGSVCDYRWDLSDARVVCRELGCGGALSAPGKAHFGKGKGAIWIGEAQCLGTEVALQKCPLKRNHDCNHKEDAGVVCSEDLRLMNGASLCSGRVEILHNNTWGTICDASWDLQDAQVVCSQLSCGKASKALGGAHHGQGLGPIWLENINCTGEEASLEECQKGGWGEHSCNHSQDASVECSGTRLVNGTNRCSGRVEVFLDGEWGSVCDDRWDLSDAQVVCRELSCGGALSAPGEAHFGKGNGAIWIDEAQCLGTEVALQKCPFERKHDCSHEEDAGVVCSDLRLMNGTSTCSGRVEVFHNDTWGTICGAGWDLLDAQVVCRQLGCGNASTALGGAHYGQGSGPIWLGSINCTGGEASLEECQKGGWGEHSCSHSQDASVECSDFAHTCLRHQICSPQERNLTGREGGMVIGHNGGLDG
ncbi:deleted in malignant brain tumors 1 protein-like [Anolis sagrei]|uniref:deleted in malignant brain tumors 1 protein-like n=1 Tax=Anolis sagrei TaxID=38937 RepID=UPI003521B181